MSKGVTERSMCRRGNIAGKGVFVLLTLVCMALFIAVAVESSKCTVCEKNSDRCSSSIWNSGASDNEAFRATFTVGDSGDFDISGCNWTAVQICSYGALLFFVLSLLWCCCWCYGRRPKQDQDGQVTPLSAASNSMHSFTRDNPHYTGPLSDLADTSHISSRFSSQALPQPKARDQRQ